MNFFKITCMFVLFLHSIKGVSQISVDTVMPDLKQVEIVSSRIKVFGSATKTEELDSTFLNRYSNGNLADLLANESQVFVKSYGLGSLATTSFRGSGASHTAVLWNGFNLQSPMHGIIDMALIPANFTNDVKIQYGGAGAMWGTGAVGGSIHLNNSSDYNRGITVATNTSFGSFSDKQQQVQAEISKKRFVTSLKVFNHEAKNDFPFINTAKFGKPSETQSNAELKEYGFLQENYVRINSKQSFNTRFWYQMNDRNIPPSMTTNIGVSNQLDEFCRATAEWQRTTGGLNLMVRAAYFDEYLAFSDSSKGIDSKSHSKVFISEAEARFSITKYDQVNAGITNTYSEAFTEEYIRSPHQNRSAVFGSYKLHTKNDSWSITASIRQEMIENKVLPIAPAIGIKGKFLRYFYLKANAAKHYRIPTFNDLYWAQGGNPHLQAESGWSEEASLENKVALKYISWELGATVFNRNIDNWIIWLPDEFGIWSPENVLQVWSRGLEYKLKFNFKKNKFNIQLSGLYNYVLSTNEKAASPTDESLGKQLIYVPIQNAQGNLIISYKGTSISYTEVYTGYRYTFSDNSKYLKPYNIGNLQIAHTFSLATSRIKAYAQINNVWNQTYQVLAYQAMPLLNYQFGLSLIFNQPNLKQVNK